MIQLRASVERTICEVRGVEGQPAAQVLVNPPAGLEEIFALQTEGKGEIFRREIQHVLVRPLQDKAVTSGAYFTDNLFLINFIENAGAEI